MKLKILSVAMALLMLFLVCSCSDKTDNDKIDDARDTENEVVQPDGTQKQDETPEVKEPKVSQPEAKEPEVTQPETEEPEVTQPEVAQPKQETKSAMDYINEYGGTLTETLLYKQDAERFLSALETGDTEIVAEYTGANAGDCEFLKSVKIKGHELLGVSFDDERIAQMEEDGRTFNDLEWYAVNLLCEKDGGNEYFDGETCVYFLGMGQDPLAGGLVSEFVKAEDAFDIIFADYVLESDYMHRFITEFLTELADDLEEGRYYPDTFDFTPHVHLVTHLMAKSGKFRDEPPYTLDEISEFISQSFEGNGGIDISDPRDEEKWLVGNRAWLTDEDKNEGRLYGCAYAHGGSLAEITFDKTDSDGSGIVEVDVTLYADYAHFLKSKQIKLTLECKQNELPKLLLVNVQHSTGRETAVVSV